MYEANAPKNSRQNAVFSRQRHLLRGSVARTALLGAVPLIALSFTGEARAQTVTWTAPSGTNASWFTAADWTDNTATHRLPAATDSPTLIQTPGIVTIGAGGTATAGGLQVLGGGELDVVAGGTLSTALNSTIGIAPASVTGGISTATSGTGTMVVSGTGSTWNASNVGVRVGFGSGAAGTLSIGTGAGTGGLLNMTGGLLTVGSTSGTGTLNINGGSVADPTAAIREGFNGGTGTINITNGGTLTTAALNTIGSNSEAAGVPAGGTGAVTIAGTGSSWVIGAGGNLTVGSGTGASGSITVSAGGTFSNQGNADIGYTGGTTAAGGTGSVTVTGAGSIWTVGANNTGALALGYGTGSSGTVLVSAGGTLNTSTNSTQATLIGYNDGVTTGGTGKLTVDGAGSTWNSGSDIVVAGGTAPGTTTVGTLTVSNGGKIKNAGNNIYVAQIPGATGTLNILSGGTVTAVNVAIGDGGALGNGTIDGAGSTLTASGNLAVGFSSSGANSLTISNGGVASFAGTGQVGQGGTGTVTVTGQGSGFTIGNNLTLGEQVGTGTLNIANNAIVTQTAGETLAGFGGAGTTNTGTVNITTGGAFRGTALVLGFNAGATGNLTMASGGQATLTGNLEVGWNGGTGTASIAGQGTSLNATGSVIVGHDLGNGGSTTGTLTVADNATLTAAQLNVGYASGGVGTLNIGAGGNAGTITAPIFMGGASSTINFNHNQANYVFSSVIADNTAGAPTTGSVNFIGSGNTTLTAVNTYTSATNVTAGTLTVAAGGSIANSSLTTISSGATLAGAGSLGNVSVANGATVAPTGTGTLTTKAITFAAGSTYQVGITAGGQNSKIAATTATLQGGTVQVNAGTGNYVAGTSYTILSATGGVTGKFASLVGTNMLFLNSALDYSNPDQVNLSLTRNNVSFASVGTTANQRAAAGGVSSLPGGNLLLTSVTQQNMAGAQTAFDALSGEAHASAQSALINNALAVGDAINNRLSQPFGNGTSTVAPTAGVNNFAADDGVLNYAEGDKTKAGPWGAMARKAPVMMTPPLIYAVWAQGLGDWMNRGSDGNAAALKASTGGILSGFDATFLGTWRFGIAGGYSHSNVDVNTRASSLDADSYHISGYGGVRQGAFGLQGGVVYSSNDISSSRTVAFPGFAQTALANYNAGTTQVFGEANYRFVVAATALDAFADLNYLNHHTSAFSETGGVAALSVTASDRDVTFTTIGLRSSAQLGELYGASFVGRGTVGWRHAFGDTDTAILASFAGGTPFAVAGTPITVDALIAEAGLDVNIRPDMSVGLLWSGQFGNNANENRLKGQFTYRW